jgi:hypothetical protein
MLLLLLLPCTALLTHCQLLLRCAAGAPLFDHLLMICGVHMPAGVGAT